VGFDDDPERAGDGGRRPRGARAALTEIRDLVGIHPVILEDRGLDALSAIVARRASALDVDRRPATGSVEALRTSSSTRRSPASPPRQCNERHLDRPRRRPVGGELRQRQGGGSDVAPGSGGIRHVTALGKHMPDQPPGGPTMLGGLPCAS
jgi:hypothetical protein